MSGDFVRCILRSAHQSIERSIMVSMTLIHEGEMKPMMVDDKWVRLCDYVFVQKAGRRRRAELPVV